MRPKATRLFFLRSILIEDISRDWGSGKSKAKQEKREKGKKKKPYRRPQDLVPGSELAGIAGMAGTGTRN